MFEPRTLEDAQQSYLLSLASSGSPLNLDVSQGSVLYSLARASAALAVEQDNRLKEVESSFLTTATDTQLENIGLSFNIPRFEATFASGTVLAIADSGQSFNVPSDLSLIDLASGLEFRTQNSSPITITSLTETLIAIQATQFGSEANLLAGRQLYSLDLPQIKFIVAAQRSPNYTGDLTGGGDRESDSLYRIRIGEALASFGTCSFQQQILKLLEFEGVERAFVNTAVGGIIEMWVDAAINFNSMQLSSLLDSVRGNVAPGSIPILVQAVRRPVNFDISIQPFRSVTTELDVLTEQITKIIKTVIDSLTINEPLSRPLLEAAIKPFVRTVRITNLPRILTPEIGEILYPGDIKVTYPIRF